MRDFKTLAAALRAARDALREQPSYACQKDVRSVALALYDGIKTPVALALRTALASGDVHTIATAKISPADYSDPDAYYLDACAVSFLKKFEGLSGLGSSTLDPEAAAKASFYEAESRNRSTNERFSRVAKGQSRLSAEEFDIISRARCIISDALGKAPRVSALKPKFGPGVTSTCKGDSVTIADKLLAIPECTVDALPAVQGLKRTSEIWFELVKTVHPKYIYKALLHPAYGPPQLTEAIAPRITRGNLWTCAPKTAVTHRGICVEPHLNGMYQLSIGSVLADVLSRLGLDKVTQQVVNRMFAKLGSITGAWATVDLRGASDTICIEIVRLLLPYDWFILLSSFRSSETWIDGRWVENHKFSSMGNGYTFELETLIFYALSRACSDVTHGTNVSPVCTFGDDIIVSTETTGLLYRILDTCGFEVNKDKSFTTGPFRESCGSDFFQGALVRPYFLKEEPTHAIDWTSVANGIRRMAVSNCHDASPDPRFIRAWLRCISCIPSPLRFFGPVTAGDAWIHTERVADHTVRWRNQIRYQYGLRSVARTRDHMRYCDRTRLAATLYGSAMYEPLSLRGERRKVVLHGFAGAYGDPCGSSGEALVRVTPDSLQLSTARIAPEESTC